jgi:5-methylcytosine-specific restriction endonuclease McrA
VKIVDRVIVLNADYSFLNIISWRRAVSLVSKGKVEVLKYSDRVIKTIKGELMKIPMVLKLVHLVRTIYKTKVPFSKRNIMVRDDFKCSYCGKTGAEAILTIDHILPKSKGGKSTWENCVTACKACNARKGNRSCAEARMYVKKRPFAPTISEFVKLKVKSMGLDNLLSDLMN